tara:strand:+ start:85 stop:972 length:888 start_codon:yes stop_codon:yes gene_type:complete
MNNIVNFPQSNPYFSQESDLYFDTWERPVYFKGQGDKYYEVEDKKSIVRMLNDKPYPLGVVGKNYQRLPTKELCQAVEQEYIGSLTHEQLNGVQVVDKTAYHGGLCIRQYIFPNIKAELESRKSDVAFRTVIINGYDGSSSFKFYNGAIDFFCTNGMVTGVYDMIYKKHTKGLTIPKLTDKIKSSIDIFYKQADQWNKWIGKEISDEDAKECFEAIPNASERFVEKLMRQFYIECLSHGRTVWALYSAATYYASNADGEFRVRETSQDHTASTLMNRERQIRSWLSTDSFQQIAA